MYEALVIIMVLPPPLALDIWVTLSGTQFPHL